MMADSMAPTMAHTTADSMVCWMAAQMAVTTADSMVGLQAEKLMVI
jgi:hypothetical protein